VANFVLDNFVKEADDRDAKSVLDLYAAKYLQGICDKSTTMKEAEPGLFLLLTSRPDIVALIRHARDLVIAEIKNREDYSSESAIDQEVCHLIVLLYWWRVLCGKNIEKVRGFTICRPECRSNVSL